ncbi:MAG TPA: hypothetical protein VGJ18_13515 [Gemmatimonadaceae bacterium]|jgi:hypothetical protein
MMPARVAAAAAGLARFLTDRITDRAPVVWSGKPPLIFPMTLETGKFSPMTAWRGRHLTSYSAYPTTRRSST